MEPTPRITTDSAVFLAQRGRIALVWSIDDVLQVRPDLTRAQAWQLLRALEEDHHAGLGISWDPLLVAAQEMFGERRPDD